MFGRRDERVVYRESDVGAAYGDSTAAADPSQSLGGAVLGAMLPETRLLRMVGRRRLILILAGVAVLAAGLFVAISWMNGKDSAAGHGGAQKFANALVRNDPGLAPAGAASYVGGVRAYFGPVSSAKIVAGHERGVNSKYSADERTYYVIEMLIQSKRGPAALEVDFDDGAIGSERISSIHELKPSDTPAITEAQRAQLTKAFAARGGHAADQVELAKGGAAGTVITTSAVRAPAPSAERAIKKAKRSLHMAKPVVPPSASAQLDRAQKQLACVQKAHQDVTKLQACTR